MTVVETRPAVQHKTNLDTPYWKHPKHEAFYRNLERGWEEGIGHLNDYFPKDPIFTELGPSPVPYDYVLAGVVGMLEYTIFPGEEFSAAEVDARWGDLLKRLPSNADPVIVYWSLKDAYPMDFNKRVYGKDMRKENNRRGAG